jgi:hypothetical protein
MIVKSQGRRSSCGIVISIWSRARTKTILDQVIRIARVAQERPRVAAESRDVRFEAGQERHRLRPPLCLLAAGCMSWRANRRPAPPAAPGRRRSARPVVENDGLE